MKKMRNGLAVLMILAMLGIIPVSVTAAEFTDGECEAAGVEFSSGRKPLPEVRKILEKI